MMELKPCPFCENEYLSMHVIHMGVSYIKCDCGAKMEIDTTHCGDTPIGRLIDSLVERWNRRVNE